MKKKKLRLKKQVIPILFLIFFIVTFCFSGYRIIRWNIDNKNNQEEVDLIFERVDIVELDDNANTIVVNEPENKADPYWDYIKTKLINVDFTELKSINDETVAWLKVEGTNINYPVVQTDNNDYYLDRSFNKTKNYAGWVFMDYRNNILGEDQNTIIYAHGRLNGTMFGSLKNILTSGWTNNPDNFIVKLSTDKENTLWQVFSVYSIPETSDYLHINLASKEYKEFLNMLIGRSSFNFNTTVNENDRILTLSTCLNNTDRVVLHAKLIKKENKKS